jgi:PAS domain S-box-containing protein
MVQDITECKRNEAALRESQRRYQAISRQLQVQIEQMPLAYLLFDEQLRITDWNPAAEKIFGYTKNEILGESPPFPRLVPEHIQPLLEDVLRRLKAGEMAVQAVGENLTKSGRAINCQWFNTPLFGEDGEFQGLMCLAQDITQSRRLEEQLHQAQKMEAVGQLAGGIAHDFNNLLTIITGYADMLLDVLPPGDEPRQLATEIRNAGERSAALTRQLLAFSRRQVLMPQVLNLNSVVAETDKLLRRMIGEDIEVRTTLHPSLPTVHADGGQLAQVLLNLAVNARDAMPHGGLLIIETSPLEIDEAFVTAHQVLKPGAHVLLTVTDTGSGMTPDVQSRIFEPFFTTKEPGKGTGLGLAVAHGIIKQSGGHIDVYSELGRGTTFKIYLPCAARGKTLTTALPANPANARGTEVVLLVEDECGVRTFASKALERFGYTVLAAATPAEAVTLAQSFARRIDLLLTDVVMPELSGRRLCELLRAERPELKTLFMSGYTSDAVVRQGIVDAEVAFIQKPFSPVALAQKVREVLDAPFAHGSTDGAFIGVIEGHGDQNALACMGNFEASSCT